MNNPDHISESLETNFWVKILKLFDADPGWKQFESGMEKIRIRDMKFLLVFRRGGGGVQGKEELCLSSAHETEIPRAKTQVRQFRMNSRCSGPAKSTVLSARFQHSRPTIFFPWT
jgi:hypothetical protein